MTLAGIMAQQPHVRLANVDAATEADIRRHMCEAGDEPDEAVRDAYIISPAVIRKRPGMAQRQFAELIHLPVATLQNWEPGRT